MRGKRTILIFTVLYFDVMNGFVFLFFWAGKVYNHGCNLSPSLWTWGGSSPKFGGFGKMGCDEMVLSHLGSGVGEEGVVSSSHCSTVERLYAWEKKLYQEVKVNFWFPYLLWAPGGAFALHNHIVLLF